VESRQKVASLKNIYFLECNFAKYFLSTHHRQTVGTRNRQVFTNYYLLIST
jgi:hypothetical protein